MRARWKEEVGKRKAKGEDLKVRVEFEEEPKSWDHSYLFNLNRRAHSLGMAPYFDFVTTPAENNGTVFLSDYFEEQKKRNQTVGSDNFHFTIQNFYVTETKENESEAFM